MLEYGWDVWGSQWWHWFLLALTFFFFAWGYRGLVRIIFLAVGLFAVLISAAVGMAVQ